MRVNVSHKSTSYFMCKTILVDCFFIGAEAFGCSFMYLEKESQSNNYDMKDGTCRKLRQTGESKPKDYLSCWLATNSFWYMYISL